MLRIVIYGPDPEENRRIQKPLADLLWAAQIKPVFKEFTGERGPFFTYVRNNPYLVMLIVQKGPEGAETVRLAKEANARARLVWFSDRDYALYAYELDLTFFGLLPVSREKAESALRACWYAKGYPPWNTLSLARPTPFPQQQIGQEGNKKTPFAGVGKS